MEKNLQSLLSSYVEGERCVQFGNLGQSLLRRLWLDWPRNEALG